MFGNFVCFLRRVLLTLIWEVFCAYIGRLLGRSNRDGDCVQFLVLSILILRLPLEFLDIPGVVEIEPELFVENICD